jgi:redox-sensitive bicupin YhaK (pirin superfamily)
MDLRNIEAIIKPGTPHFVGDGFRVHNFIPKAGPLSMQRMDPFIMMDYNADFYFPPSAKPKGVGAHPHRGFETVTIVYKGKLAHHDSSGNSGVIGEGDVQWMTAASGILHQEYHEHEFSKMGGNVHMVQLWVNLPAKDKKSKPKYQDLREDAMGKYKLSGDNGVIEVIAGSYMDVKGPAFTFTPIHLLNAKMNKGGIVVFDFPAHYNTGLLVIEGEIRINDNQVAATNEFVLLENKGTTFTVEAIERAIILVFSGESINEPIVSQGPFVMNTLEELNEAFMDYNMGRFGFMDE